jgi:hypothetical protein
MDPLEKLCDDIHKDPDFITTYDVSVETDITGSRYIQVKRKDKPPEDRLVYTPYGSDNDYHPITFCFQIYYVNCIMYNELRAMVFSYSEEGGASGSFLKGREPHAQKLLWEEVDVPAILRYISNEEWNLTYNREKGSNEGFLASNEYRCVDCQKKMRQK